MTELREGDCQWCKETTKTYGIESDANTLETVQRTTKAAVSMRDALHELRAEAVPPGCEFCPCERCKETSE